MDDYQEIKIEERAKDPMKEFSQVSENKVPETPKKKKKVKFSRVLLLIIVVLVILGGVFYDETISYTSELMKSTGLVSLTMTNNDIAAVVGDEIISMEELNAEFEKIPEMMRGFTSKSDILERMINQKMLLKEVVESKIESTEEEVQKSIDELKEQNMLGDVEFKQRLEEAGTTVEEFWDQTKKIMSIEKYFDETIFKDINFSEEEVKQYYEENVDLFKVDKKVKVVHILISTEDKTEEEALEIVDEINSRLEKEEFEDLVEEYSDDPGKVANNGVYEFGRNEMVPEFEVASFDLEVGEISEPVKTTYGYHLIKSLSQEEGRTLKLDEVKEDIQDILGNELKDLKVGSLIDELKEKYDVMVYFEETSEEEVLETEEISVPEELIETE